MSLSVRAEFFNVFNRVYLPLGTGSNLQYSNPFATSTFNKSGRTHGRIRLHSQLQQYRRTA